MNQRLLVFTLCLSLCCSISFAQTPPAKGGKPQPQPQTDAKAKEPAAKDAAKEAELTALHQRALALLREAGEEAATLADKRHAARIQATAADRLWPHQVETARKFFAQAFENAVLHYRESKDENRRQVARNSFVSRTDVRLEVIRQVKRHDAALGRAYTDRYLEEKQRELETKRTETTRPGYGSFFGDNLATIDDLLRVAETLLEVDAKTAVELGERAFALGVSPASAQFLVRLAAVERAAADRLYVGALAQLQADPAPLPASILVLTAYPFGESMVRIVNGNDNWGFGFGNPKKFELNPQIVQRFLATSFAVLSRVVEPQTQQLPDAASRFATALYAARALEPRVREFQPALLPQWQATATALANFTADKPRESVERSAQRDNERRQNPTANRPQEDPRALLDQAEKATDINQRDQLYYRAAQAARESGDAERALEYAGKITDAKLRRDVKSWIAFEAAREAARAKRYEDARQLAAEVVETDQRAMIFLELAREATKERNRARAVEMLEEAFKQARDADNSAAKVRALLGLTHSYAAIDPLRSFETAEEAVRAANQLAESDFSPHPEDAQLVRTLQVGGSASTNSETVEGFDMGNALAALAHTDFERVLSMANSLSGKPLKFSTVVTIAASVFKEKGGKVAANN